MQEDIDHPAPPLHPPTGGDVPTWILPAGSRDVGPDGEVAVFLDSEGNTTFDSLREGVVTQSPEEVVRMNFIRLRKAKGWTQAGAAHRLTDVSHGKTVWSEERIKRLERGRYKSFKATDLFTFCQAFGVALWELLLPKPGELIEYSNNLVDRDTAASLLFHVDSDVLDRDGLGSEISRILRLVRDEKWRKRWELVERYRQDLEEQAREQLEKLRSMQFDEFLQAMVELEKETDEDDGTHT